MADIKLSGMSIPIGVIDGIKEIVNVLKTKEGRANKELITQIEEITNQATPEVLTAAYARISRDPRDVDQLVQKAQKQVEKARKSNQNIIYGMGHHSVADHALINFNIKDVSRLAVERIEERRVGVGYTEKSQRYITLDANLNDIVMPGEFSPSDQQKFKNLVRHQNQFYKKCFNKIDQHLQEAHSEDIKNMDEKEKNTFLAKLKGKAKEDARYAVCLATKAQLGCSYQGQTLEHSIRMLRFGRTQEEKDIADQLYKESRKYVPSLIQLTEEELFEKHNPGLKLKDDNFKYTEKNLRSLVKRQFNKFPDNLNNDPNMFLKKDNVTIINSEDIDLNIIASVLHHYSKKTIKESYGMAKNMIEKKEAPAFVKTALQHISEYDKVTRDFEMSRGILFEAEVSASCFAQLKRHRMMTLLSQDYDPELDFTTPENIIESGMGPDYKEIMDRTNNEYKDFSQRYDKAAEYLLTNGHKRKVLIGLNMRQLYHVSRTREDEHAQWEIRNMARIMSELVKKQAPVTTLLLGGQHEFDKIRQEVYR